MVQKSRNSLLVRGVEKYSRAAIYAKRALYKKNKVAKPAAVSKPLPATKTVQVNGAKNGKTRTVAVKKTTKFYPAEDIPQLKKSRKNPQPAKLRQSIQPGTVLILLAGRHRGKRVVFLKQLPSGLLLVSGPFQLNGVPLRRVNQAYVMATSTHVDVSKVKLSEKVSSDAFYKAAEEKSSKKPSEAALFKDQKKEKKPVAADRVAEQKAVDATLLEAIKKVPELTGYLSTTFSLQNGQFPHLLKF